MRTSRVIIVLVVAGVVLLSAWQLAVAAPRRGEVRARFVRLVERRVGDREYLGILVRPLEGKGEAVLLMGRDSKQAKVARTLREGQKVEVAYVIEDGHKWATRITAEKPREGDDKKRREAGRRPATAHDVKRLIAAIGRLEERITRLEREVRLLREQRGRRGRVESGDRNREEGRGREGGDRDGGRRREAGDRDGSRRREGGDRKRD